MRIKHLLTALMGCFLLLLRSTPSLAQVPTSSVGVFYIGPEDTVAQSINLANPYIVRVDQPELAQVIIINNARISEEDLRFYGEQVRDNRLGLVIFCGRVFPASIENLGALLGISAFGMTEIHTPANVNVAGDVDALHSSITWSSAPELYARTVISNPNILLPLISTDTGQPVIQRIRGREPTQTLIMSAWLNDAENRSWTTWPYYHYLIYRLIVDAAGQSRVLKYANYPLSPVPQRSVRWIIAGAGLGVILGASMVFYLARRYRFMRDREWRYSTTESKEETISATGWDNVGFHRPLAGMLIMLPLNLLLFFALL
ncbi:MAG: hypothetical protein P1S60_13325, partial [Anaerolineae bacterium]|nr:hypothetical protein [Anaerolineae bacterium]